MAEINIFHYRKGDSLLHRLDPRTMLAGMVLLSLSVIGAGPCLLAVLSVLLVALLVHVLATTRGSSVRALIGSAGFFSLLFMVIVLARGLSGSSPKFIGIFSIAGTAAGLFYCWQLGLILILGQLFLLSTDFHRLEEGLYLLLRYIPWIPAHRIASLISLTLGFIPLVFDQYREVRLAWLSRLGNLNKNHIVRINTLALPLLEGILRRADETACAMESRCYRTDPPDSDAPFYSELKIRRNDLISLLACAAVLGLSFVC
ncbi:MAG: energy-coupling factor transporter transmembrane protein EcfT [Spirochaetales bacterium]|nr:energy-coupling factor transporter transmembrane protein EcfT [Spirochaetales bacterium]